MYSMRAELAWEVSLELERDVPMLSLAADPGGSPERQEFLPLFRDTCGRHAKQVAIEIMRMGE